METDTRFATTSDDWSCLGSDLTELILSYLPLRFIVRAGAVCKTWRSVVTQSSFSARVSAAKKPWFFICGKNNIFSKNNQAFGFDPEADEWIRLPTALFPSPKQEESFIGSGGFFFTATSSTCSRFSYAPVLKSDSWRETPPLRFSRCNPLVGVFSEGGGPKFIVVGGVRFIGGLVDIEDRLAVEIYDPAEGVWELCPPLPADFRSGNSSQWLSSALLGGKLFVFGIYSCYVSAFDLGRREWSGVRMVRPPGVLFSFLVACGGLLVLAGLCNTAKGASSRVLQAEFVKSSKRWEDCPSDGVPEFALVGRSNVGKSSLLNSLVRRKRLALTSKKPGKTQCINHFRINDSWYLVDLPGYGFAAAPQGVRIDWDQFTRDYFLNRKTLVSVFLLIDASIPAKKIDLEYASWLGQNQIPMTLIFTKCDKRKRRKNGLKRPEENVEDFQNLIREFFQAAPPWIMTSSVTNMGRDEMLLHMAQLRNYWLKH